jgi:hypothetical protein
VTYVFNQRSLVLEGVTLAGVVQLVVEVLVDLAGRTVLDEETAEDAETTHPYDLRRHTGVGGTPALTETTVSAVTSGEVQLAGARSRVHGDGLLDDEAIADELSDGLAGVGVGDLADLVGVEPDLVLSAADDRGGQALLGCEIDPVDWKQVISTNSNARKYAELMADDSGVPLLMTAVMGDFSVDSTFQSWWWADSQRRHGQVSQP